MPSFRMRWAWLAVIGSVVALGAGIALSSLIPRALAFTKLSLLLGAAAIAACAWLTTVCRLVTALFARSWGSVVKDPSAVIPPPPREEPSGWEAGAEQRSGVTGNDEAPADAP